MFQIGSKQDKIDWRHYFWPKLHIFSFENFFSCKWIFEWNLLQNCCKFFYNCFNTSLSCKSLLNKYNFFKSVHIPCRFNVSSWKMIIISNHTQILPFFFYYKVQLCLIHHVHYAPLICGKWLLKFWNKFWKSFEFFKFQNSTFLKLRVLFKIVLANKFIWFFFFHQNALLYESFWKSFAKYIFLMQQSFTFKDPKLNNKLKIESNEFLI